jgi:hypothetical protein
MRYEQPSNYKPLDLDGQTFTNQDSLGLYLIKKYKLRTEQQIAKFQVEKSGAQSEYDAKNVDEYLVLGSKSGVQRAPISLVRNV